MEIKLSETPVLAGGGGNESPVGEKKKYFQYIHPFWSSEGSVGWNCKACVEPAEEEQEEKEKSFCHNYGQNIHLHVTI